LERGPQVGIFLRARCVERRPSQVPVISRFFGIVVFMNYRDHNPPHFHARYQDQEVIVEIESGLVTGVMSRRALGLIFEWFERHQPALQENWERARAGQPLEPIPPLS
jgi:hypothetical protein